MIGPNGTTLKAIELLTNCYIVVQGNTVSAVGPYKGLQHARNIVIDTMNNIHPIYNIKKMMIKRELAKDEALKNENWERFLPKFESKTLSKRKQPLKKKQKKEYTPFPPSQPQSKIDKELETGEYFLKEEERKAKRKQEKSKKQQEMDLVREEKRNKSFIPPVEPEKKKQTVDNSVDINKLKKKVNNMKKKVKSK